VAIETKPKLNATHPVRMRVDLVEMLDAITWADGLDTTADGIDAVLRPLIEQRFAGLPEAIQQRAIARIEAAAK
jgi:hypothetical protein